MIIFKEHELEYPGIRPTPDVFSEMEQFVSSSRSLSSSKATVVGKFVAHLALEGDVVGFNEVVRIRLLCMIT
jgi:hypothetical protein